MLGFVVDIFGFGLVSGNRLQICLSSIDLYVVVWFAVCADTVLSAVTPAFAIGHAAFAST